MLDLVSKIVAATTCAAVIEAVRRRCAKRRAAWGKTEADWDLATRAPFTHFLRPCTPTDTCCAPLVAGHLAFGWVPSLVGP